MTFCGNREVVDVGAVGEGEDDIGADTARLGGIILLGHLALDDFASTTFLDVSGQCV